MDDTNESTNHIRKDPAIITPPYQELVPAGQKLLRILQEKSDLPPYVDSKINEELNAIAETFLTKIRSAMVNLCFEDDYGGDDVEVLELTRRKQHQQKHKSILTIVDKDWYTIEHQYEKAIRFFPDVLREKRYKVFPIGWMSCSRGVGNDVHLLYNLQFISLIPLVTKLGIELQQFDEIKRGGLLCEVSGKVEDGTVNLLQLIVQYIRSKEENNNTLKDEVFFSVWERLRKENLFKLEDIRQFQLTREYFYPSTVACSSTFMVRNLRYLVDWDPAVLAVPLCPEHGDWLPIHFCADNKYRTIYDFIEVVRVELKYNSELGHLFTTRTQNFKLKPKNNNTDDDNIVKFVAWKRTPFELACKVHGQPKVVKAVLNCFAEYCNSSYIRSSDDTDGNRSTSTHDIESSLLLSAVTDESIYLDGLYILLRQNPLDALSKLHQHVSLPQYDPERTQIVTNQDNDDDNATGGKTGEKKRKYDAVGGTDGYKQH